MTSTPAAAPITTAASNDLPVVAVSFGERSAPVLALAAAARGVCKLLWLVDPADPTVMSMRRLLTRTGTVLETAGLNPAELAAAVATHGPAGLTTFNDSRLIELAELAAMLQLRFHTPEVARRLVDKVEQRTAFAAGGLPALRCLPLPSPRPGPTELAALVATLRYPAVVKPRQGTGSSQTFPVADAASLLSRLAELPDDAELLVEELIPDQPGAAGAGFADYVSVETVVVDGHPTHLVLTGRFPQAEPFRETGFFIPADVDDTTRAAVVATADQAVAALGVRDGALHIEVKLSPQGPRLIEVNGRAGGWIPALLASVSDVSLLRACLQAALGVAEYTGDPVRPSTVAYRVLLQPTAGERFVEEVNGLDAWAARPEVDESFLHCGPGSHVDERHGSRDFVATLSGRVDDHDTLRALYAEILATVDIRYAPVVLATPDHR